MSWIETIETVTVPEHACYQAAPGDNYASASAWLNAYQSPWGITSFRASRKLDACASGAGAHVDAACFQTAPECVPCLSGVPVDDEPETPEEASAVAAARTGRTMTTVELLNRLGFDLMRRRRLLAEKTCRRWASKHKAP